MKGFIKLCLTAFGSECVSRLKIQFGIKYIPVFLFTDTDKTTYLNAFHIIIGVFHMHPNTRLLFTELQQTKYFLFFAAMRH